MMDDPRTRPSAVRQASGLDQPVPTAPAPMPARESKYNSFDGPIPGQSLTEAPGNAKWEHPPQFVDPGKAMDFVYKQLMRPNQIRQTIALMKQGVPVEGLVRTILFTGFASGKWTPDVALLITKPLTAVLVAMAKRAGIKNLQVQLEPNKSKEPLKKLAEMEAMGSAKSDIVMGTEPPAPKSGFMKR